ncbi:MAG: KpsF/GutQ family sugar-phosphate isomerase [Pseudomonadota bacterium]
MKQTASSSADHGNVQHRDHGRETIATEIAALNVLYDSLSADFDSAVTLILQRNTGRLIVTGIGKSGHIGQKIAATLASTGTPAMFVHAAEAAHGDLGMISERDTVLAISKSGASDELQPVLQYCRRFGVPVIGVTSDATSPLGSLSDVVLLLPDAPEGCPLSLAPMASTTMTLALGDALAASLLTARGFSPADFAQFHPGGKLGAQLMRLSELMDKKPELRRVPHVLPDASIAEVVSAITESGRGVCGVSDANGIINGVVTDGDVRRGMADGTVDGKTAATLMSTNPLRIEEDSLAVDALKMCQDRKVNVLFVTGDDGGISGVVHLQDLLREGLV